MLLTYGGIVFLIFAALIGMSIAFGVLWQSEVNKTRWLYTSSGTGTLTDGTLRITPTHSVAWTDKPNHWTRPLTVNDLAHEVYADIVNGIPNAVIAFSSTDPFVVEMTSVRVDGDSIVMAVKQLPGEMFPTIDTPTPVVLTIDTYEGDNCINKATGERVWACYPRNAFRACTYAFATVPKARVITGGLDLYTWCDDHVDLNLPQEVYTSAEMFEQINAACRKPYGEEQYAALVHVADQKVYDTQGALDSFPIDNSVRQQAAKTGDALACENYVVQNSRPNVCPTTVC